MMPMALLMTLLHSLGQDDQYEVKQEVFDHLTPLASVLASCDTNDIINGTSVFVRARQLK